MLLIWSLKSLKEQENGVTKESNVGHEAAVVVIVRAAGDRVWRHLAVHVKISKPGPADRNKNNLASNSSAPVFSLFCDSVISSNKQLSSIFLFITLLI